MAWPSQAPPPQVSPRITPLLVVIVALFATTLITANIIAVKLVVVHLGLLGDRVLPAAIIIFPVSYIIGDILTEVYGYTTARRVIWLGFLCNLVAVGAIWGGGQLEAVVPDVESAYDVVLGSTPRILGASFAAYLVGEFTNAFILSRLKLVTQGRWLWSRTIGSTVAGQGIDTLIFITLAFYNTIPSDLLREIILTQWLAKVAYEALATPLTYGIVSYLKRVEGVDTYDRGISFNPVAL